MAEGTIPAGKKDDLHPCCRVAEDLDHRIQAAIIGIDQWVVQDERDRTPLLQQHVSERNARSIAPVRAGLR